MDNKLDLLIRSQLTIYDLCFGLPYQAAHPTLQVLFRKDYRGVSDPHWTGLYSAGMCGRHRAYVPAIR